MKYKFRVGLLFFFVIQMIITGYIHFKTKAYHVSTIRAEWDVKHVKEHIELDRKSDLTEHIQGSMYQRKEARALKDHYVLMPERLGRLGNWLFQYGAVLTIARKLNYKFIVSPSHPMTHAFDLPNVADIQLENLMVVNESQWTNRTWQTTTDYLSHNLTFRGYFQRFTYFINNSKEIKEAFKVKPTHVKEAELFLEANTPKDKTLIGVHVRRGDFLRLHAFHRGKLAGDKKFFTDAMNYYRKLYSDAVFVIVSDDHEWCRQNLIGKDIVYSNFTRAINDFAIMILSDHTIISSGTFSWWAGYLCGGRVVYLANYPIPGSHMAIDIIANRKFYYFPDWVPMFNRKLEAPADQYH